MGGRTLRVLVCEDNDDDYELLLRELGRLGYCVDATRVETHSAMKEALANNPIDLVFSDWSMPTFSAPQALEALHKAGLDLPFIIVSGTVSEEVAVEALKKGAHDFLVKARLARLGVVIERELREADARRESARMQEQLMISDRMASVGILAAGVAHEINNPLAAVLLNLELAIGDLTSPPADTAQQTLREELEDARAAAVRVRDIVRDLRIFSRTEEETREAVDVERVMESTLRMASNEIRHRARLVRDYRPVRQVVGNEARLGQVFLNLVVNAAQALPEGRADKNEIRVSISEDGDHVRVEVADSGPGLAPETMGQLFKPFYTTKPAGIGTGLGLSICHRIVTSLGGRIYAENRETRGARFVVLLPPGKNLKEEEAKTQPLPFVGTGRRGRVLIVDDDQMIARAVARAIGNAHDVSAVTRGADALGLIESGQRFDVIICDLMMPEMTGMELYEMLLRLDPDQARAVIFLTGGAFTPGAHQFLERVENVRVEKPFDSHRLRALVNDRVR